MARQLAWSPEAVEDLQEIGRYIARDSALYARAVVTSVVETAESLPEHPRLGRAVPEYGDPDVRERFVYSYRLVYRVETHRLLIVAVVHGSLLLSEVMDDRD